VPWALGQCVSKVLFVYTEFRYSVATHLRCGGTFSDSIITNFLLILTVNNFENRLIFGKVKAYKNCAIFGPPCITVLNAVRQPIALAWHFSGPDFFNAEMLRDLLEFCFFICPIAI